MFRARTAENVAINVALRWLNQLLGVVTKIVLVRLLFPADFGVYALASGLIGFVGTFGNFGLDYAIVQKSDKATEDDYDVGMSLRILIAVGLFAISIVVAGPWASLFGNPVVAPTTQILSLMYLLGIWSFIPSTRLVTELRYRAIAIPALAGQVANTAVSILLAVYGYGVWALVWGAVMSTAISTIAYSVIHPWRFRFSLRRKVAAPLVKYAQHLISAAVLAFLITNIDNFTVGYVWKTTELGYYSVAYVYGYLPVSMFSGPAGQALFPSLTKIQGDLDRLRRGFLEGFGYAMAIIAPSAIGMAVLSPEVVNIVFGPNWTAATLPLLILCFYGLFRAIVDFSSSLFGAIGRPRIIAELNLYILILSLVPLVPLTIWWGINGTAVAMTIPVVIVAVYAVWKSAQVLQGRMREFYERLRGPMIATEAMGVCVFALRLVLLEVLPARVAIPFSNSAVSVVTIVLFVGIAAGIVLYFAFLRIVDRESFTGFTRTVFSVLGRRIRNR